MIPSCISSRSKDLLQRALALTASEDNNQGQTHSDIVVSDVTTSNNLNNCSTCVIIDESGQSMNCEIVTVSSINNTVDNDSSDIYFCETSNVVDIGLNIQDVDENSVGLVKLGLNTQSVDENFGTISFNENETNHNLQVVGLNLITGTSKNHVAEDTEHLGLSNDIISSVSADRSSEICLVNERHDMNHPEVEPVPVIAGKKRRKFQTSVQERKKIKLENLKLEHCVQPPCHNCKKK